MIRSSVSLSYTVTFRLAWTRATRDSVQAYFFVAVINTMIKNGKERVYLAYISQVSSPRGAKAGTKAEITETCCLLACFL